MPGELVLLTARDCHMCAHGRAVLGELGVAWREVRDDDPAAAALASSAPPLRPVLFGTDGDVLAYGRLSSRRLRRDLERGPLHAIRGAGSSALHGTNGG